MDNLPNLRLVILFGAKRALEQNKAKRNNLYQQIKTILIPPNEFIRNIRQLQDNSIVEGSSWANKILLDNGSLRFFKNDDKLASLIEQFPFNKSKTQHGIMSYMKILSRMRQLIEEHDDENKEVENMLGYINNTIEPPADFVNLINDHFSQFPFLRNDENLKKLIEQYSLIEEEEEEEEDFFPPPQTSSAPSSTFVSSPPSLPESTPIFNAQLDCPKCTSDPTFYNFNKDDCDRFCSEQMQTCRQCKDSIVYYAQNKAECDELDCVFKFKQQDLKNNYETFRGSPLYPAQFEFDTLADEYAQKIKSSPVLDQTNKKWDRKKIETIANTIDPLLLLKLCEEVRNLDDPTYERIQNDPTHRLHFAAQLINMLLGFDSAELNRIEQNPNHFAYYIVNILDTDEEEDIPDEPEDVPAPSPTETESLTIDYFVKQAQNKINLGEVKEYAENILHLQQNIEDTFKKCVEKLASGDSDDFIRTRPAVPESDRKHDDPVEIPGTEEGIDSGLPGRQIPSLSIVPKVSGDSEDDEDDEEFYPDDLPHLRDMNR